MREGGGGGDGRERLRSVEAFRRLAADACRNGDARGDALLALALRTVLVATPPDNAHGCRTLTNSTGSMALPVFTHLDTLQEASMRFGWAGPDGTFESREVGSREALNHALAHGVQFVVVDIGAPHQIEIDRAEIEALVNRARPAPPRRQRSAQRRAPPSTVAEPREQPDSVLAATPASHLPGAPSPEATFGGGDHINLTPLRAVPDDVLLETLADALRGYPEVEWACLCLTARGPAEPQPTVGLRVDASFRARVAEITSELRAAATHQGAYLDVVLLDDPSLVRAARSGALMFFPWRRS